MAVLPLAEVTPGNRENDFTDGLTDALLTELGSVANLRVISRTFVIRYKNSQEPLSSIAAQLRVDHVLEGSVTRDQERIRVSARLIRATREQQVWANTYERELKEILSVQPELARAVATEIGARLSLGARATSHDVRPEAYSAYLW